MYMIPIFLWSTVVSHSMIQERRYASARGVRVVVAIGLLARLAYCTVRVPFMVGWTSHWNLYVPAGSAGTW